MYDDPPRFQVHSCPLTACATAVETLLESSVPQPSRIHLIDSIALLVVMACLTSISNAQVSMNFRNAIAKGNSEEAIQLLSQSIAETPNDAELYYHRGSEYFRANKITESLADFDHYVKLVPKMASQQWKRGIAAYYAGQHKKGSDQFKLYQTFHGNDVENAVWKAMCDAKLHGFEQASKEILPITNDRRPPMMEIYAMFKGEMKPEQVLKVAEQTARSTKSHAPRFYAHQYIGLFYEAQNEHTRAKEHMELATKLRIDHYMWDVARVHLERMKSQPSTVQDTKPGPAAGGK